MSDARERRAEMSDVRQGCGVSEVQMFFGVLGPLVVEHGGLPVPLGAKQRLVLAMLLMNAGRPVSVDRLIDGVWGDEPPDSAVNTLQVHISQLRRSLAAGDPAILTQPPGYLLRTTADQFDLLRFEELNQRGHDRLGAGRRVDAAEDFVAALDLWRGPPLEDLAESPFAASARTFLEERRLGVVDDLLQLQLDLGHDRDVVEAGEQVLSAYPLREGVWEKVILALYRSGRQADALAHYRACREVLLEELGVEPMRRLQLLEQQILRQDRHLDPGPRRTDALVVPAKRPGGGGTVSGTATVLRQRRLDAELILADGTAVPLPERLVLGRHRDCDVVLADSSVSRRHAEIRLVSGRFVLLDLSSTNGTWVDGQPVLQHPLTAGDTFQLGDVLVSYRTL